jgi:hypothetical protein
VVAASAMMDVRDAVRSSAPRCGGAGSQSMSLDVAPS